MNRDRDIVEAMAGEEFETLAVKALRGRTAREIAAEIKSFKSGDVRMWERVCESLGVEAAASAFEGSDPGDGSEIVSEAMRQFAQQADELFGDEKVVKVDFKTKEVSAYVPRPLIDEKGLMNLMSMDDVECMPDPRFLIDRLFPEQGVGVIYGDSRSKKSFLMLTVSLCIAYGMKDFFGDKISCAEKARVLYLAGEGANGFKGRIRAFKMHFGISENSENFMLYPNCPDFLSSNDMDLLMRTIDGRMGGVKLLVIDTLARALPGTDENGSKDMGPFFKVLDAIARRYGCLVVFLHHASKSGDMRGSTAIRGAVDFAHRLTSEPGSLDVTWFCDKMKDGGSDGWSEQYRLTEYEIGTNVDGKVMTSLGVSRRPNEEVEKEENDKKAQKTQKSKESDNTVAPSLDTIMHAANVIKKQFEAGAPIALTRGNRVLGDLSGITPKQAEAVIEVMKSNLIIVKARSASGASGMNIDDKALSSFVYSKNGAGA